MTLLLPHVDEGFAKTRGGAILSAIYSNISLRCGVDERQSQYSAIFLRLLFGC